MVPNLQCPICGLQHMQVIHWCPNCGAKFRKVRPSPFLVCGTAGVAIGGVLALYYWQIFDVTVRSFANISLIDDRKNGLIVSLTLLVLGAILLSVYAFVPKGVSVLDLQARLISPPPKVPAGFPIPLQTVLTKTKVMPSKATLSFPVWTHQVNAAVVQARVSATFTDQERQWAYDAGFPPDRFLEFMEYVDNLRTYHR